MKNIYYIFFFNFFILTYSCKTAEDNTKKVNYGFVESYKLGQGESEYSLNEAIVAEYEDFIYFDDFNLPLNKYIKGNNYKIYISAAIENNEKELLHKLLNNTKVFNLIDQKKNDSFTSLFLSKKDFFVIQVIYSERKQKIPFILSMVSKDSTLLKENYDKNILLSKIN